MMTARRLLVLCGSIAIVATPLGAQQAGPPKETRICKPWGGTGSRIRRQKCMTAAEWRAEQEQNVEDLRQTRQPQGTRGDATRPGT